MAGSEAKSASNPTGRRGVDVRSTSPARTEGLRAAIDLAQGPIRRYLFGVCGDWHEAEDIAQESLLKAWERRDSFDGRADAKTWLYAVARNCWLDRLRSRRRRPREETVDEQTASRADPPAMVLARGELADAVALAVTRLPDEQREALAMRESQGLTFIQIAQLLNVPTATAKSRVRYALLKLAQELKGFAHELEL